MKILTVYDGTLQSKTALLYGLRKAKDKGGEVLVLQVFQSNLFIDYDAGPRAEEIARAEAARHRRDAETLIRTAGHQGVPVRALSGEGDTVSETLRIADEEKPDLIIAPPRYKAIVRKSSCCPVYIMPGIILVPVDSSDSLRADLETIRIEAEASGSKVLLLGVVPIHLYSAGEKEEVDRIAKSTAAVVKKIRKKLQELGIEATESTRAGYLDEEILKAADQYSASLIMLPAGGKTPSELAKAASILQDEPQRVRIPVYLMPAHEGEV